MLLYSSRAKPSASLDRFSDYDFLLAVTRVRPYYEHDGWPQAFGDVLSF
jgi:hypothetical protein